MLPPRAGKQKGTLFYATLYDLFCTILMYSARHRTAGIRCPVRQLSLSRRCMSCAKKGRELEGRGQQLIRTRGVGGVSYRHRVRHIQPKALANNICAQRQRRLQSKPERGRRTWAHRATIYASSSTDLSVSHDLTNPWLTAAHRRLGELLFFALVSEKAHRSSLRWKRVPAWGSTRADRMTCKDFSDHLFITCAIHL
jgi:hypothetical protein